MLKRKVFLGELLRVPVLPLLLALSYSAVPRVPRLWILVSAGFCVADSIVVVVGLISFFLLVTALTLSEAIKTLDFSLPSYDAIANSKASVETVDGLAEKYAQPETPRGMSRKPKPEPKESSGGNPLSAVLPSMKKSNVKKPKTAKPASREATEKEDTDSVGVETMDLTLPSYSFSSGKEKSIFAI